VKMISVDKGFHVHGGLQLFGKFLSLKKCMKACAITPTCFSGDYNPWLHKCYQHSNLTACDTARSHPQFVHFSKVPCCKYSVHQSGKNGIRATIFKAKASSARGQGQASCLWG